MTDIKEKMAQLRKAHEAGILDEETYRSMLDALGVETAGDTIDISADGDAAFAKDSGKGWVKATAAVSPGTEVPGCFMPSQRDLIS